MIILVIVRESGSLLETVVLVAPDGYRHLGDILGEFVARGVRVSKLQTICFSENDALELYDLLSPQAPLEQMVPPPKLHAGPGPL